MSRRKMVTTVTADTQNNLVSITVEHEDWQSFSRTVIPRANKEFKRWIQETNPIRGSYDLYRASTSLAEHSVREDSTRCISVFRYGY